MAERGDDVLRFGPLQAGRSARSAHRQDAVRGRAAAQRERAGTAYNLVGFQTRLTWPAQREVVRETAGTRARRMAAPRRHAPQHVHRLAALLDARLNCAGREALCFAGQITGAGATSKPQPAARWPAIRAARAILGLPPVDVPSREALGAVVAHLQNRDTPDFQPSNVTWAPLPPLSLSAAAAASASGAARWPSARCVRIDRMAAEALYAPSGY